MDVKNASMDPDSFWYTPGIEQGIVLGPEYFPFLDGVGDEPAMEYNPWMRPELETTYIRVMQKWSTWQPSKNTKNEDWESLNADIRSIIACAYDDEDKDGVPLIGTQSGIPELGSAVPEQTKIVILTSRLSFYEHRNGVYGEKSNYPVISNALKKHGVEHNQIACFPLCPILLERDFKFVPDHIKNFFWPLARLRLRILAPEYVIAFAAEAAEAIMADLTPDRFVKHVDRNVIKDLNIDNISFKFIAVKHPYSLNQGPDIDRDEFDYQMQVIGNVFSDRKRRLDAYARGEREDVFKKMRMAGSMQLNKIMPKTTWEFENNVHVSEPPNRPALARMKTLKVDLIVNVAGPVIQPGWLTAVGMKSTTISGSRTKDYATFKAVIERIRGVLAEKRRVAVYCSSGMLESGIFVAAIYIWLGGLTVNQAAEKIRETRGVPIPENRFKILNQLAMTRSTVTPMETE